MHGCKDPSPILHPVAKNNNKTLAKCRTQGFNKAAHKPTGDIAVGCHLSIPEVLRVFVVNGTKEHFNLLMVLDEKSTEDECLNKIS